MEAVLWLPANSRCGVSSPLGACFMQIPASESLLFLFSLTEGENSGWNLEKRPKRVGVVSGRGMISISW